MKISFICFLLFLCLLPLVKKAEASNRDRVNPYVDHYPNENEVSMHGDLQPPQGEEEEDQYVDSQFLEEAQGVDSQFMAKEGEEIDEEQQQQEEEEKNPTSVEIEGGVESDSKPLENQENAQNSQEFNENNESTSATVPEDVVANTPTQKKEVIHSIYLGDLQIYPAGGETPWVSMKRPSLYFSVVDNGTNKKLFNLCEVSAKFTLGKDETLELGFFPITSHDHYHKEIVVLFNDDAVPNMNLFNNTESNFKVFCPVSNSNAQDIPDLPVKFAKMEMPIPTLENADIKKWQEGITTKDLVEPPSNYSYDYSEFIAFKKQGPKSNPETTEMLVGKRFRLCNPVRNGFHYLVGSVYYSNNTYVEYSLRKELIQTKKTESCEMKHVKKYTHKDPSAEFLKTWSHLHALNHAKVSACSHWIPPSNYDFIETIMTNNNNDPMLRRKYYSKCKEGGANAICIVGMGYTFKNFEDPNPHSTCSFDTPFPVELHADTKKAFESNENVKTPIAETIPRN